MKSSPVIIFRLSSFGDLILSTGVLKQVREMFPHNEVLFVTRKEYSGLLVGNPFVDRVVSFDKHSGLWGWIRLCLELVRMRPVQVYDLHSSTRTRLAKMVFVLESLISFKRTPAWRNVSKERFKSFLYYVLKRKSPTAWKPTMWAKRFARLVQKSALPNIDLRYLLDSQSLSQFESLKIKSPYVCVMPSSRWKEKEWSTEKFLELLLQRSENVFVLGTRSDKSSLTLFEKLNAAFQESKLARQVYFYDKPMDFRLASQVLNNSVGFIGVDTGFFHLAESLGVKSLQILGPTEEGLGFGPRLASSKVASVDLFCRPCSKNGKYCYRFWDSRACLKKLNTETVKKQITF